METMKNAYGIGVNKWCASCRFKEVENDGTRTCLLMQAKVPQRFACQKWQLSDGLKNAGLQMGGVVRLRGTQEIIIS